MGGTVQLGLRSSDGKSRGVESYTSSISAFFDNDRFIEEDIFHVADFFVDQCDPSMKLIIPNCYGLVFGDHLTKKIHSVQGYTSLMSFSSTRLALHLSDSVSTGSSIVEQENYLDCVRFRRLFDKGYITQIAKWKENGYVFVDLDSSLTCDRIFDEITDALQEGRRPTIVDYIVDSGYTIINYQETSAGYRQFRDNLISDGIELTDEELHVWENSIKDFAEDEDEYEELYSEAQATNVYEPDPYTPVLLD